MYITQCVRHTAAVQYSVWDSAQCVKHTAQCVTQQLYSTVCETHSSSTAQCMRQQLYSTVCMRQQLYSTVFEIRQLDSTVNETAQCLRHTTAVQHSVWDTAALQHSLVLTLMLYLQYSKLPYCNRYAPSFLLPSPLLLSAAAEGSPRPGRWVLGLPAASPGHGAGALSGVLSAAKVAGPALPATGIYVSYCLNVYITFTSAEYIDALYPPIIFGWEKGNFLLINGPQRPWIRL